MRTLWPREHGAYVQLLAPIVVAIAIAPTLPGALLALAACATVLAHEPLRVAIGRRGRRARAELGEVARRRVLLEVAVAAAAAVTALVIAPRILPLVVLGAAFAGAAIVLAIAGREHTLGGELVAAAALASAGGPIVMAGDASWSLTLALWLGWTLGFASTVVAVHAVLDHRRRRSWQGWALGAIAVAIAVGAVRWPAVAAAAPLALASIVVTIVRPRPSRIRTIGVALAITAALAAALAIALSA